MEAAAKDVHRAKLPPGATLALSVVVFVFYLKTRRGRGGWLALWLTPESYVEAPLAMGLLRAGRASEALASDMVFPGLSPHSVVREITFHCSIRKKK